MKLFEFIEFSSDSNGENVTPLVHFFFRNPDDIDYLFCVEHEMIDPVYALFSDLGVVLENIEDYD